MVLGSLKSGSTSSPSSLRLATPTSGVRDTDGWKRSDSRSIRHRQSPK